MLHVTDPSKCYYNLHTLANGEIHYRPDTIDSPNATVAKNRNAKMSTKIVENGALLSFTPESCLSFGGWANSVFSASSPTGFLSEGFWKMRLDVIAYGFRA